MKLEFVPAALAVCGLALAGAAPPDGATLRLRMEPSATRVGIAKVALEVSDLEVRHGAIVGRYRIRIPLAPMLDDEGTIELRSDDAVAALLAGDARLTGTGHSDLDGRTHGVACDFGENSRVAITIDNGRRILVFETTYHLTGHPTVRRPHPTL